MVTVGVEWIEDFPSTGCVQDQLAPYPQLNAEGFLSGITFYGHSALFDWGDDNAWATDFQAPASGGDSLDWSDNVNFCWFADHGGNQNNVFIMGFSNQTVGCFAYSNQMTLGVKNMKWLVLDCCDAVLGTDIASVASVWGVPMQGVHMIMGFVGISSVGPFIPTFGYDFGVHVGSGAPIASEWLNNASDWWAGNTAIVIAAGDDIDQAQNRLDLETVSDVAWNVSATNSLAWSWWE